MSDREQAKKSIAEHVSEIENDNVLRSMIFVMGDYMANKNGAERADYITPILRKIVRSDDFVVLKAIYSFADALCEG